MFDIMVNILWIVAIVGIGMLFAVVVSLFDQRGINNEKEFTR